jgi:hypothetical protein
VALDAARQEGHEQVHLVGVGIERPLADPDLIEVVSAPDSRHVVLDSEYVQSTSGHRFGKAATPRFHSLPSFSLDLEGHVVLGHINLCWRGGNV